MSTRPDPVTTPIYLLSELPEGTKVRAASNEPTWFKDGLDTSPTYVEVVAWPEPEPRRVPWHQAFTERLPIVELGGQPISVPKLTPSGDLVLHANSGLVLTVPADGMVTVHEPEATEPTPAAPDGATLIAAERQRQVTAEGWTPEHDDEHVGWDLSRAAMSYISAAEWASGSGGRLLLQQVQWPWAPEAWKPTGDPVRDLVKAGALIAAEIDRVARLHTADGMVTVHEPDPEPEKVASEFELPGMWEKADFEGGEDEVRGPERVPDPTPEGWHDPRCTFTRGNSGTGEPARPCNCGYTPEPTPPAVDRSGRTADQEAADDAASVAAHMEGVASLTPSEWTYSNVPPERVTREVVAANGRNLRAAADFLRPTHPHLADTIETAMFLLALAIADGPTTPEPADTTDPLDELAPFVESLRTMALWPYVRNLLDAWDRLRGDR